MVGVESPSLSENPDGHVETLGPFTTDSTGSTYTTYVPTQIGNYTITTNFPNNTYPITSPPSGRTAPIQQGTILLESSISTTLEVVESVDSTILSWSSIAN